MLPRIVIVLSAVVLTACETTSAPKSETAESIEYKQRTPALNIELLGQWDGRRVPSGEQCSKDGGKGATPPLQVTGIPKETSELYVFFDDVDDAKLSQNGGLGVVAFEMIATGMILPPLPAMTRQVGSGARVVRKARTSGDYASNGYLPPCSGGQGHRYVATVLAVADSGESVAVGKVMLGKY